MSTTPPTSSQAPSNFDLDDYVDRFEIAWNQPGRTSAPNLTAHLPSSDASSFQAVAIELIRIDMERRADSETVRSLVSYLDEFPWLRQSSEGLAELAFEEYRLRLSHGESVDPAVYRNQYNIDTTAWPRPRQATVTDTLREWNESTVNQLYGDATRLVDLIDAFPQVGQTIEGFTICELLGEGEFARVYLARQGQLADRLVVLKMSAETWSESDKLARLQHTHIVPVYSIHQLGQLQGLCMPYLGRRTLEQQLKTPSPEYTTEQDRALLAAKLADGLQHAHQRGVIHRDLKPANILISDDDEPLILDFNLSEQVVVGGPTSLLVGGTLPYMAPEHLEAVLSGRRLGPQCDIYSLGVILYQLTTGQLPFAQRHGSFVEMVTRMARERHDDSRWQSQLAAVATPDFVSIVRKCLEPESAQRYQSAADLRTDLLAHAEYRPLRVARNRSLRQRLTKWCHRHRRMLSVTSVASVAVLLAAVALAVAWVQSNRAGRLDALRQANLFEQQYQELRLPLMMPNSVPRLKEQAESMAKASLATYGVLQDAKWRQRPVYRQLPVQQQEQLDRQLGELLFLLGSVPDTSSADQASYRAAAGQLLLPPDQSPSPPEAWDIDQLPHDSPPGRRLAILERIRMGRYHKALPMLQQAVEESPDDDAMWMLLGVAQAAAGDLSEAELSFTRCVALRVDGPLGYFHRGLCRLQNHRYQAAAEDFAEVLQLIPGSPAASFNRALALEGAGEAEQALVAIEDLPASAPLGYRVLKLRARLLETLGRTGESEAVEQHARRVLMNETPTDAEGWLARGLALRTDDPAAAIDSFQTALRLRPNDRDAMRNLAAMYAEIVDRPDDAIDVLRQWQVGYPLDPIPHASEAVLHARNERDELALKSIERALTLGRSAEVCYYAASAYSLISQRDPAQIDCAIDFMRLCLNQDPTERWFSQAIRDPDLVPLRPHRRFGNLFAAANLLNHGWPAPASTDTEEGEASAAEQENE